MNLLLVLALAIPLSCLALLSSLALLGIMTLGGVIHVLGIVRAHRPQWRCLSAPTGSKPSACGWACRASVPTPRGRWRVQPGSLRRRRSARQCFRRRCPGIDAEGKV